MLKGISALLNADVLHALRAMGHGDDLILTDSNFPADSIARQTCVGRLLRIDNVGAPAAAEAVLSIYPLDSFVDDAAGFMQGAEARKLLPVHKEVQRVVDKAEGRAWPLVGIERFAFYERARKAYAIIQTGEGRAYGNFAFRKGVIVTG